MDRPEIREKLDRIPPRAMARLNVGKTKKSKQESKLKNTVVADTDVDVRFKSTLQFLTDIHQPDLINDVSSFLNKLKAGGDDTEPEDRPSKHKEQQKKPKSTPTVSINTIY